MSEIHSEHSEKASEDTRMMAQASTLLREIAEPRPVGDTVKAAITRAARLVSAESQEPMSYGRAEDIWRREARRIDAAEMDAIRAAHAKRRGELRAEVQEASALAHRLAQMAAQAAASMAGPDADRLRATADEARKAAHTLRRLAQQEGA